MPNEAIARLIAKKLSEGGLVHPGNPAIKQEPFAVPLPLFRNTAALPQEHRDLQNATAKILAEAIIYAIETDGDTDLVDHAELQRLQLADAGPPTEALKLPVICRRCNNQLMLLTVGNDQRAVIDGRQTISRLSKLHAKCPHREYVG
jgi:hypothetical protein